MHFIEARELTKTYLLKPMKTNVGGAVKSLFKREKQTITALDDISFHIDEHELIGYIGPNGAGKSTTMKILSGILVPDSGQITVNGKNSVQAKKRACEGHRCRVRAENTALVGCAGYRVV